MMSSLQINLLKHRDKLQISHKDKKKYIFDPIRKKHLVLTPEELVRQLIILFLNEERGFPLNKIRSEMGLKVNGMQKRCDLLVFDPQLNPLFLVECKAPKVKLTESTFEQIAQYNMTLKVPYLLVSNGPDNYCCKINHTDKEFIFLLNIPNYTSLIEKK